MIFFLNLDYVTEKYIDIVSEKAHIKEPLVTVYKLWHISGTFTSLCLLHCASALSMITLASSDRLQTI